MNNERGQCARNGDSGPSGIGCEEKASFQSQVDGKSIDDVIIGGVGRFRRSLRCLQIEDLFGFSNQHLELRRGDRRNEDNESCA